MALNETDQDRVNKSYSAGVDNFTAEDLEKVKADGEKAEKKAKNLGDQFENFKLLWQLLKDYWSGDYKNVPWRFIAAIGFAVAYLVAPIDVIPDILPIIGFVDDAAVFALVIKGFDADVQAYKEWKAKQIKE